MTKTEIIEETAKFYNNFNRSASGNRSCWYLYPDGEKKCAVGRCMTDDALVRWGDYGSIFHYLVQQVNLNNVETTHDTIFLDRYQGHDVDFWNELQCFHDNESYWNDEGLSNEGKERYESLLQKYEGQ